jgi:DNA repair protein SbcC/Rad50
MLPLYRLKEVLFILKDFRIQIKDFQSLENVELVIEEGLNIVIGKTNEGKTAIIRAIDSALFNMGKDEMVRVGKRYSGVMVNNGTDKFIWRRDSHGKNEKTLYQINDEKPMTKVGRGQIDEIANLFNISEVKLANGVKEKINFWYQGEAPFLTNKTAGQLFVFLSQSSCDKYMKITKQLNSDRKSQKHDIEITNANIDTLRNINEVKKNLLEANVGYDKLYEKIVLINDEVEDYNKIQDLVDRYNSCKAKVHIKTKTLSVVEDNLKNINFNNLKVMYESFIEDSDLLDKLTANVETLNAKRTSREKKCDLLTQVNTQESTLSKEIKKLTKKVSTLETLESALENISELIQLKEAKENHVAYLKNHKDNLEDSLNTIDIKSIESKLNEIVTLNSQILVMASVTDEYYNKNQKLKSKEDSLSLLNIEYNKQEREFEDFKADIGVCPYCNNTLTQEHTH